MLKVNKWLPISLYLFEVKIRITNNFGNFIIDFEQKFTHMFQIKVTLVNMNKSNQLFSASMKWVHWSEIG